MSTGILLLSMAACGLVTFLIRLSFIAFGQHLPNDPRFTAALRYVPPAILGALIAPEIFALNGSVSLAPDNPRLWAALAALLGLVLTTPLPDLIGLLRRLRCPDVLLDLMVLCYRMLFVFSAALHDTATAQRARLGYASPRLARRSLGLLAANLTLQVWQRAQGLHRAAQARNGDGALRLLSPEFAHARRDTGCAAVAGALLVILARLAA